jgi:predicted  nucleic acid-binding Zn-ribbon protein
MDDLATKEFIERAKAIHGERYDYSRSRYTGSDNKLIIICREHGPFRQSPYNHTSSRLKCGCPRCAARRRADVQIANAAREFIQRARARHGDRYDYSKVSYKSAHSKVLIGCPLHGDFWQKADSHIRQSGCPKCGVLLCARLKIEQASNTFVAKAQKVHGHKYDYSETRYLASREKVVIRCRKHGPYLQTPNHHLNGDGCPCCHRDSLRSQFTKSLSEKAVV